MIFTMAMHKARRRCNASTRNLCTQGVWCTGEHWRFEGSKIDEVEESEARSLGLPEPPTVIPTTLPFVTIFIFKGRGKITDILLGDMML
jgi:hypothetical protein